MELKERPGKYGNKIAYYDQIEPELQLFDTGIRVLPAPFFYDKKLMFIFKRKHEPGTKMWPEGGYELRGPSGEFRAFDLDQVIIHPGVFENIKRNEKIKRRQEKERIRRDKKLNELAGIKGKRGRKPLSEAEKLKRKLERELNPITEGEHKKGRKPLTQEERIKREAEKLVKKMISGGKRGRKPMSADKKAEREKDKELRRLRSGGKKGRPKKK